MIFNADVLILSELIKVSDKIYKINKNHLSDDRLKKIYSDLISFIDIYKEEIQK